MPTGWAGARGIPRINEMDRHTRKYCLIDDIGLQLRKGPAMECCALRPSSPHPRANMRQVFQRYRSLRAFGRRNNPFGETVVHILGKAGFLPGQDFEPAAAALRAFLLQLVPESPMPITYLLDRFARMHFSIAINGDIGHTQINTQ